MGIVCINRYSNNDTVVFPVNLFMCVLYQAKIKKNLPVDVENRKLQTALQLGHVYGGA